MKNRNASRVMRNKLKAVRKSVDVVSIALSHITRYASRITVFLLLIITFHFSLFTTAYAVDLKSRAAVVLDATTGRVLYAKNPELRLHPASTTKLMTALIAVDKMNLSDVVTISRKSADTAPIRAGFRAGDRVTIETLLYAALVKSGNDAAVALAEAVAGSEWEFVKLMNRKALAIGAYDTHFVNASGLPGKGQYITAYDLSKLMRHAIRHPALKEILGTKTTELSTETGKTMLIRSTNKLLWSDDDLLGGKTGYTNKAKHCFVCAGEKENETLIVALLGNPRRELLWKEAENLMGVGSRVLADNQEPVIYLTRADYEPAQVTKASHTRKTGTKIQKKQGKSANKTVVAGKVKGNEKKPIVKAGKKGNKNKQTVTAGKKSAKKKPVIAARGKDYKKKQVAVKVKSKKRIAEKVDVENNLAQKGKIDDEG